MACRLACQSCQAIACLAGTASVCVCAEGKGSWVLIAKLVRCLMHPSPSAGTRISIDCLYGGCIQRTSLYCFFQGLSPPVLTMKDGVVLCSLSSFFLQVLPVPFNFCTFSLLCFQALCAPSFLAYLFFLFFFLLSLYVACLPLVVKP